MRRRKPATRSKWSIQVVSPTAADVRPPLAHKPSKNLAASARASARWLFRLVLILMVLLLIGGLSVFTLTVLRRSWPDDQDRNIVIISNQSDGSENKMLLVHISPSQHKAALGLFSSEYPIESIDQSNLILSRAKLTYALGEIVDQIWIDNEGQLLDTKTPDLSQVAQAVLLQRVKTPLHFSDRVWLFLFVLRLREDQVFRSTFSSSADWEKNRQQFQLTAPPQSCSISVINATGVAGVGAAYTKLLENSGLPVIRLSDTPTPRTDSAILFDEAKPECLAMQAHLDATFNSPPIPLIQKDLYGQYRTQVVILLGNDVLENLAPN